MGQAVARLDLLVAGHVIVDRYLQVERLPEADRTVPVVRERVELGGTATNLARAAAQHGVRTGILSRIGEGFPASFLARLRNDGIDLRGLTTVRGTPTPTCTILEERSGTTRMLVQQGPMAPRGPLPLPGPWSRRFRWVHLGTGDPRSYVRFARAARQARQNVAFDPAQELMYRWDRGTFLEILPFAEVIFGNRAEIARATAWAGPGGVKALLARVPLIVRTEGAEGATAFYRGGSVHVRSRRPRHVRTFVGAGDSFRGGFYGGWFAGAPLRQCLAWGNRAALARIEKGPTEG